MLNQPVTSSSHWRIPTTDAPRAKRLIGSSRIERSLWASLAPVGAWAQVAARSASHAVVAALLVGGVLVAPVLALLALLGLFATPLPVAHHLAPALIFVSLLWLALAILGAHMQMDGRSREQVSESTED
jgi:hypothetical protein